MVATRARKPAAERYLPRAPGEAGVVAKHIEADRRAEQPVTATANSKALSNCHRFSAPNPRFRTGIAATNVQTVAHRGSAYLTSSSARHSAGKSLRNEVAFADCQTDPVRRYAFLADRYRYSDCYEAYAEQIQRSLPIGSTAMETAEHREPYESRGSPTDLGVPGGESPPGDST